MNYDQNIFAGSGILIANPITDRTDRGTERIQFKLKHTYGDTETYYLGVAYGEDAHKFYARKYEEGMFLTFSGSIKLVTNKGAPYIQLNLDRVAALAHYTGPKDGIPASQETANQADQTPAGPFDNVEDKSRANHAGTQTVQQRPHSRSNPPQNNQTSQPRSGASFAGVPGSSGNNYIDRGPFPDSNTLAATPKDRAPLSADPWAQNGMRKAAASGFR
tara:strand:+ start:4382 stop:5035 length:654 start_codon:yes stop_codon:yes gene_type:complete